MKPAPRWGDKAVMRRSDQGQDYQGNPGEGVVAIGKAKVVYVNLQSSGFGNYVVYQLLDGPAKGQRIYVGHAQANVHEGQVLYAGQRVATLLKNPLGNAHNRNLPGWTEIGLAGADNNPVLHGTGSSGGAELLAKVLDGAGAYTDNGTPTPSPDPNAVTPPLPGDVPTTTDPTGQVLGNQLSSSIYALPQVGGAPQASAPLAGDEESTYLTPQTDAASSWQLIASNGPVSQDTIRLAQLASYGQNGPAQ